VQTVGIRELKAKLSEYLRRAQEGESISVTDRGKTIACIAPDTEYPDLARYDGSSLVRDPGVFGVGMKKSSQRGKTEKPKSYAALLKETQKAWGYKTPKETLTKALEEHLRYKKQLSILDLAGTIDYDQFHGHRDKRVHENAPDYTFSPPLKEPKHSKQKHETYASLLKKAQQGGKHATEKETLSSALKEYLRRQGVERAIAAFGTIEYHPDSVAETQRHRP
jgi:prevent-host-death family protein